jgi:hypothetical protein
LEKGKLKGMFVSGNIPAGAEYKAALKDVLQAFPYFQLAQVLFAKQMYDTHEPEASSRIKLASVYAPDRKAMYLLFKANSPQPIADSPKSKEETIKSAEKPEVKYNFVYSSTTVDNSAVINAPTKVESEQPSLSEAFLRHEQETATPKSPIKEAEEKPVIAAKKTEEKAAETPKISPIISVKIADEKIVPVEEKKVEVKKPLTTYTPPPKKAYTTPLIEKKKPEAPIAKPEVDIKPPVGKAAPIIEKKPEIRKPAPVTTSGKKPYTQPVIEWKKNLYGKKGEEKKPEVPKSVPPVIAKPPAVITPPVKAPIIENKPIEKKVEQPIEVPIIEKSPVIAAPEPIIEEKAVEKIIEKPIIQEPVIIEEKKAEPEKEISVEVTAPLIVEEPVIEEVNIESAPLTPSVVNEEPEVVHEPITDTNLKYNFGSWLKVLPEIGVEKKEEVKPVSQAQKLDIIEKFLQKAPSISRPKAEFFSPVKAAKMSVTEDDTIVSETLANIYYVQGNYPKALKAYQTLLLQFPEKKNIFAPRIKEIKALMSENTKPGKK